jgi:hypothetical protein
MAPAIVIPSRTRTNPETRTHRPLNALLRNIIGANVTKFGRLPRLAHQAGDETPSTSDSHQDSLDHLAGDIRQAVVAPLMLEGQTLVVNAQKRQDKGRH